jgi:hypothetical protein
VSRKHPLAPILLFDLAGSGRVGLGRVCSGEVGFGLDNLDDFGPARFGSVWLGTVGHGRVWQGEVWFGYKLNDFT